MAGLLVSRGISKRRRCPADVQSAIVVSGGKVISGMSQWSDVVKVKYNEISFP